MIGGPVHTLHETAQYLVSINLCDEILPKGKILEIERRAMRKLRQSREARQLLADFREQILSRKEHVPFASGEAVWPPFPHETEGNVTA